MEKRDEKRAKRHNQWNEASSNARPVKLTTTKDVLVSDGKLETDLVYRENLIDGILDVARRDLDAGKIDIEWFFEIKDELQSAQMGTIEQLAKQKGVKRIKYQQRPTGN